MLRTAAAEIKDLKDSADDLVSLAKQYLAKAEEGIQNLTRSRERIKNGTEILKKRTGIFSTLNPQYREMYLVPTMEHANELMKVAEGYRE